MQLLSGQTLNASYTNQAVTQTRAIEVRPYNHANFTVNVRDIPSLHGSPTKTMTVYVEGSNDGQNSMIEVEVLEEPRHIQGAPDNPELLCWCFSGACIGWLGTFGFMVRPLNHSDFSWIERAGNRGLGDPPEDPGEGHPS